MSVGDQQTEAAKSPEEPYEEAMSYLNARLKTVEDYEQ